MRFENFLFVFVIGLFILGVFFVSPAFGHGFGGETLKPVPLGNKNATIYLSIEPSVVDQTEKERRILVQFFDPDTDQIYNDVTYDIKVSKGDEEVFQDVFFDEIGFLILKIVPTDSEEIKVFGAKEPVLGGWMKDSLDPITIEGSIFSSGGLYNFDIEILSVDSVTNVLDEPLIFNGAISLAEKTWHDVKGSDGNTYQLGITSYFDQIGNFEYNNEERSVKFSMPFSWEQEFIDQIEIVHEEIHVPKTFGDLIVTKYVGEINGVSLPNNSVIADDYSEDNRIVHIILPKAYLQQIREEIPKVSGNGIEFYVKPSEEITLPLSGHTTSVEYQVDLWWDPTVIKSNELTKFYVDVRERYVAVKEPKPITFDFVLEKNGKEILRQNVNSEINAPPKSYFVEYQFSDNELGTVKVLVENIDGKSLAETDFMVVVEPQEGQTSEFPIRLFSMVEKENGQIQEGNFYVDLIWFSSPLKIDEESEFVITIYDESTGNPLPQAEYDFVLLQDGNEIHRTSGMAQAASDYKKFNFSEEYLGEIILRIENIDQTEEFVEIPILVTPEFPVGSLLILPLVFLAVIIASAKYGRRFYE